MNNQPARVLMPANRNLESTGTTPILQLLQVEDEPNDALLCQIQLQNAGFQILADVVASKDAFVEAIQAKLYDIVLTDYKLPGWSGSEVLRILREDGRDIPCILVTGSVGEEIAAKCIKQGATDYILKDRPARLPHAIKNALEEKNGRAKHREAERSRNRLASIVESSVDAIVGAADDGAIVNWNPGADRMFGYSAEEVYGRPLMSLFAEDVDSDPGLSRNRAAAAKAIQHYEAKGTKKNGEVMELAVTISPIQNSDGSSAGNSAIIRDITTAKRQQREQLTNQKLEAVGHLAGGVAHDFNNLLTVINGYARMLQRKGSGDPKKLDAILQAGERGQRLTKQLLMFSRKQITQFKSINLNSLVAGFLDMLRPLIGAHIELRTILAPDLNSVLADSGQLEQVIMNLAVNARDAMPDGGIITIETRNVRDDTPNNPFGFVVISVSDSGVGMSAEVQSRIFEPFFTTKEIGKGTGLGLSTSSGIIAHCKGQMTVESELGSGTKFTIRLPASGVSVECAEPPSPQQTPMTKGSGTVLVAEDDSTVRDFVVTVLKDQGYCVLAAENGAKALELCASHPGRIQALVTDVVMPEMNGRVLAERAKLMRPNLKVLFVSGYVDKGLKDEDVLLPSCAFLEKPFTQEALLRIVGDFCRESTADVGNVEPND